MYTLSKQTILLKGQVKKGSPDRLNPPHQSATGSWIEGIQKSPAHMLQLSPRVRNHGCWHHHLLGKVEALFWNS